MSIAITIVHVLACLVLVLVVLLQTGKGADMGAVFGGSSQTLFGSGGAGNFLTRLTTGAAVVFMLTSLTLSYIATQSLRSSVFDGGGNEPPPIEMPAEPPPLGEPPVGQAPEPEVAPVPEAAAPEGAAPAAEAPAVDGQAPAAAPPADAPAAAPEAQAPPLAAPQAAAPAPEAPAAPN